MSLQAQAVLQDLPGQSPASQSGTVTVTIPNAATKKGSLLVLQVGARGGVAGGTQTAPTVSAPSGGGTWVSLVNQATASQGGVFRWFHLINAPVVGASGISFTLTYAAGTVGSYEWHLYEVTNILTLASFDAASAPGTAASISPSTATAVSLAAGNLMLGGIFYTSASVTPTLGPAWAIAGVTELGGTYATITGAATGEGSRLLSGLLIPPSAGVQTLSATLSSSVPWVAYCVGYSFLGVIDAATGAEQSSISGSKFAGTLTQAGGGGTGTSIKPWPHGCYQRQGVSGATASGFEVNRSSLGGYVINSGASGEVAWANIQPAPTTTMTAAGTLSALSGPGLTAIDNAVADVKTYNASLRPPFAPTSAGANNTLPWSSTNRWHGLKLRIAAGLNSPDWVLVFGNPQGGGNTRFRGDRNSGTWQAGADYALNDGVLFTVTETVTKGVTPTDYQVTAGFVCAQAAGSGSNAPPSAANTSTYYRSNTWWKQVSFLGTDVDASSATGNNIGHIPRFWSAEVCTIFFDMEAKLAARYDGVPEITEVLLAKNTTVFNEPCQRQISSPSSTLALINAGYTETVDQGGPSVVGSQQHDMAHRDSTWAASVLGYSFNPKQEVTAKTGAAPNCTAVNTPNPSETDMEVMASYWNSLNPVSQFSTENNSFRFDYLTGTSSYPQMYKFFFSHGPPIGIQTAQLSKFASQTYPSLAQFQATIEAVGCGGAELNAVTHNAYYPMGGGHVELPTGYHNNGAGPQASDAQILALTLSFCNQPASTGTGGFFAASGSESFRATFSGSATAAVDSSDPTTPAISGEFFSATLALAQAVIMTDAALGTEVFTASLNGLLQAILSDAGVSGQVFLGSRTVAPVIYHINPTVLAGSAPLPQGQPF